MWFVYILECSDKTLYTGITTDVARRLIEHNTSKKGAKYTSSRRPVRLIADTQCESRSKASRLEAHIKKQSKDKKLHALLTYNDKELVKNNDDVS